MDIDWPAFATVLGTAFTGAVSIVLFYSLGIRMLVRAGRMQKPASTGRVTAVMEVTEPAPAQGTTATAAAAEPRHRAALALAFVCFALCGSAVVGGLFLILTG